MATKIKTLDEAKEAVKTEKGNVKEAKKALTDYYKENKLKKTGDYSGDKKHSKKIAKLEKEVEKASTNLTKAQEAVKELKPAASSRTKYDYPDDVDTPEKRKKYRQKMRAEANGDKPKKKKASKAQAKKEESPEDTGSNKKSSTKKTSSKKKPAKKKVTKKKVTKKKTTKAKGKKKSTPKDD